MDISIIIPVLNEAKNIAHLLTDKSLVNSEIIIIDGGSEDGTAEVARKLGFTVIDAPKGRSRQMNLGATLATGDVLLFLHADSKLPTNYQELIANTIIEERVIAGAFSLKINSQDWRFRFIEILVNWRSHLLSLPYGDQGIFVRKEVFQEVGGFEAIAIMEDFVLMKTLKKYGKISIVSTPIITSARRWQKLGIIKTTLINQLIIMGYYLGVSPNTLRSWYR